MDYKPEGYNAVSPYFVVDDAPRFIEMLQKIFDGKELRKFCAPDGRIIHTEVKIDDSVIMLGNSSEEYPSNRLLVHVYVENVDAVFKKAINSGCEILEEPKIKEEDPDKRGMFKDFAGNVWAIGTKV